MAGVGGAEVKMQRTTATMVDVRTDEGGTDEDTCLISRASEFISFN
jgi:hypothetical protein